MRSNKTPCCALRGLHGVDSYASKEEIIKALVKISNTPFLPRGRYFPTTVQVVSAPHEPALRKTLWKIGFRVVAKFRRADEAMDTRPLHLHLIDLANVPGTRPRRGV